MEKGCRGPVEDTRDGDGNWRRRHPAAATLEFRDQSGVVVRVMRASFVVSLL